MSAPAGSARRHTLELHDELVSLSLRMVGEYPQLPAGSVMRCVARAVRRALRAGTPREQIPARAEHTARLFLAGRHPEHVSARRTEDRPSPLRVTTADEDDHASAQVSGRINSPLTSGAVRGQR